MPIYKAVCSQCETTLRARTRTKLLSKLRKHLWKHHATWMKNRIKAGKRDSRENPTIQDLVSALQASPREAIAIYKRMTNAQYRYMKAVMDAIEPILPIEARVSWKALEAIHDELGK